MLILEWWKQLGRGQQIGIAAGAVTILLLVAALSIFVFSEKYVPLLGDREMTDQGAVVGVMDAAHVQYRVDSISGKIMVPESEYEKARSALQKQGFSSKPQNGFEVFDHSEFGMTDFAEKINYQRALEGEIARTVMGLDNIRYARVHLVLPDNSLFRKDKEPPKAVVTIDGEQGKSLTREQIEGIQMLVASAVPGLVVEQVALLNHRGVELTGSASGGDSREGFVQKRMRAKSVAESYLSEKIYRVLTPLFPDNTLTVSVDVDISLDHVISSRDQALPSKVVSRVRSVPTKSVPAEEVTDEAADGETPPKPVVVPKSPARFEAEYQIGHVHDQVDQFPGAITRLSVAIVVPEADDVQIEQVKELVIAAVGLDPKRGDLVSVVADAAVGVPTHTGGLVHADHPPLIFPEKESSGLLSRVGGDHLTGWIVGLLSIVILICLMIIFRLRQVKMTVVPVLSDVEREELLKQVREWLRQSDPQEEAI